MKRSWPDMVFSKSYNFLHGRSLPLAHRLTSLTWRVPPVSSPPSSPCSQRTPSWPRSPGGSSRRPTAFVFSVLLFKWKHWIERHMGAFIICTGNHWLAEIVVFFRVQWILGTESRIIDPLVAKWPGKNLKIKKHQKRMKRDKTDFVTKQCKLRQKQFYNNTVGTQGGSEPEAQVMTEIEQNVFNIKDL